ncbi:hypothetical protein BHU72_09840 [Desulfuribacillus stibiiarsenatis]|uniref:Protein kinase domain-containing protein n=1 Tax=Desulfuribacillus stibiiarsenatis TaxID=1390249 RepID=A0A1E5L2Y0_9FIRM|nr:AarF/ABC1/UbiB kinase family protein [Desulfuribacillus stibiiarsenatis]OEH84498.1 hypothetical protein BHU72_09840 [Desulfuribacillus stibiiarsenatis]
MKHYIKLLFNDRFRKVFFLFLYSGLQFWWLGKIKKFISTEASNRRYKELYQEQAVKFTNTAIELQGLLIKLGQFFSSRVDILPKEYTDELSKLQDAVQPVDAKLIRIRMETELGTSIDNVFSEFSEQAIAAASLGQVHKARLKNGQEVAVKVLRPGIEEIIAIDLQTLRIIIAVLKRFTKFAQSVDLDDVNQEFHETINDELDYVKEGKSAEQFQANFADEPRIYVPKIYWDYTTEKLLVLEYIDGVKITDLYAVKEFNIASDLAETIFSSYLKQVLVHGFFHADPHPGNLLVTKEGTLVFIDFGMMGYVQKNMKESMVKLVTAVFKRDAGAVVEALDHVGFLRPNADKNVLIKSIKILLNNVFGDMENNVKNIDLNELAIEVRELMYSQPFQIPARTTFLGKALITLAGICRGLDENFDAIKVSTPYISELLPGMEGSPGNDSGSNSNRAFLFDQAKTIALDVIAIPEKLNRMIDGLETGELRFHPSKTFEQNMLEHQSEIASRVIRTIITAGVGVIGAILYNGDAQQLGSILMVVSGFTGLGLFFGRSSNKQGRRKRPRFHP